MTIKTLVNQKPNKNDETHTQDTQNQNLVVANGRNTHRNVLNQIVGQDNQNTSPRDKRSLPNVHLYEDSGNRHRHRQPSKNSKLKRDRERDNVRQLVVSSHNSSPGHQNQIRHPSPTNVPVGCPVSNNNSPGILGNVTSVILEEKSGYNSGDEHISQRDAMLSPEEWNNRDINFVKAISERGLIVKEIIEDGACLFRAISLQIYGDQDMHEVIRQQTMDYIFQNREYYAQFVTEDITKYVSRKRHISVHGNHIEIQAMSEMYNRPVELYCYELEPINIFNSEQISNGYEPLRLSYQRCSHYNAIINPYKASVGVGLGLAGYRPDEFEQKQFKDAVQMSEEQEIEQTMFEDKLKTTDWEATNEAIEEQIARESYLQWCRDNLKNDESNLRGGASSSTVTSATVSSANTTSNNTNNNTNSNNTSNLNINQLSEQNSDTDSADSHSMNGNNSPRDSYRRNFRQNLGSSAIIAKSRRRLRHDMTLLSPIGPRTPPSPPAKKRKCIRNAYDVSPEQLKSDCIINPPTLVIDSLEPSTSSSRIQTNLNDEPPVSVFYQSLLESSYTDDGVGQLSEQEMIHKALQMSRIDFNNPTSRYFDEEYDSSP